MIMSWNFYLYFFNEWTNNINRTFLFILIMSAVTLPTGNWTYDNGAVLDGPEMDFKDFLVRLAIGGGGVDFLEMKKKNK